MNIALTGGGTAGHIMPNIALIPDIEKVFDKYIYIGSKNSMEEKICLENNIPFFDCPSIKFDRIKLLSNLKIPFVIWSMIGKAKKILINNHVDIIFCKGGYVSLPTALAGKQLNIPIVCHESDMSLGLANRIISKFAKIVFINPFSMPQSKKEIPMAIPLREQIFEGNKKNIIQQFNIKTEKPIILVVGGSLGARSINNTIYNGIEKLNKNYFIIHLTGKEIKKMKRKDYIQIPYVTNIQDFYDCADVIISRCGATACQEILALGKKAIFIPLPSQQSRGDQIENARNVYSQHYANLLIEDDLSPISLDEKIKETLTINYDKYCYDKQTPRKICTILAQL